eukprot:365271-Amphidinium_carterae.2
MYEEISCAVCLLAEQRFHAALYNWHLSSQRAGGPCTVALHYASAAKVVLLACAIVTCSGDRVILALACASCLAVELFLPSISLESACPVFYV